MSKTDLRKAVSIAPKTIDRLRQDEEVIQTMLNKRYQTSNVEIGGIMEFLPEVEHQN